MSPTAKTLERLRKMGYTVQVVERWNPHAMIRQDLFGCIDVVAIRADQPGVLGVQACAGRRASGGGDTATHLTKAMAEPRLATWLAAGNRFEIWAWRKPDHTRGRHRWELERLEILGEKPKKALQGEAGKARLPAVESDARSPHAGRAGGHSLDVRDDSTKSKPPARSAGGEGRDHGA